MAEYNHQEDLRIDYHTYLELASKLPDKMKERGVFYTSKFVLGEGYAYFDFKGNLILSKSSISDKSDDKIPLNFLDEIIRKAFDYKKEISSLKDVHPRDMRDLVKVIKEAEKSLSSNDFYLKE